MRKYCSIVFAVLLTAVLLAGCGWSVRLSGADAVGPGELFDVNDTGTIDLDGIDRITIVTVSDESVVLSGGSKIEALLKGQCRSTTEPVWLDARKDGSTAVLEVKYPKFISFNDTKLSVTIPVEFKGSLSVRTVSGNITAEELPFRLGQVSLGTVSGEIRFGTASCEGIDAETTSGGISLKGIGARTSARSISGEINLDYTGFAATEAGTVSGNVTAVIPAGTAFKVEFDTVSGSFTSHHPSLSVEGTNGSFSASAAGGGQTIRVKTTSGGFTLESK